MTGAGYHVKLPNVKGDRSSDQESAIAHPIKTGVPSCYQQYFSPKSTA